MSKVQEELTTLSRENVLLKESRCQDICRPPTSDPLAEQVHLLACEQQKSGELSKLLGFLRRYHIPDDIALCGQERRHRKCCAGSGAAADSIG